MSVVVSDTSPLHYLVLCGAEGLLPDLFRHIIITPTVFRELQQANTPPSMRQWAASLPDWVSVQSPKALNLTLNIDPGETEAISLAQEIHAAAILIDDRAGRRAAIQCGLAVVGTIGLLELAAARDLIDLPAVIAKLRLTNVRLDPELMRAALLRDQNRRPAGPISP